MKSLKVQDPIYGIVAIFFLSKVSAFNLFLRWATLIFNCSIFLFSCSSFLGPETLFTNVEFDDVVEGVYQKSKLVSIERSKLHFPAGSLSHRWAPRSDGVLPLALPLVLLKTDLSACLLVWQEREKQKQKLLIRKSLEQRASALRFS